MKQRKTEWWQMGDRKTVTRGKETAYCVPEKLGRGSRIRRHGRGGGGDSEQDGNFTRVY